jgi:hypothetical protein
MAPDEKIISLEEAREICEQLRPAFAGYVTDGNVSDRDVLATLMDLIVRGYIGIDMDSQKKPVKVKRVYFLSNPETLLPFEREFISELFSESKELNPQQVKEKIKSKEPHRVISENLMELENSEIVKSLLLLTDKDDRKVSFTYYASLKGYEVKTVGDLQTYVNQLEQLYKGTLKMTLYSFGFIAWIFFLFYLAYSFGGTPPIFLFGFALFFPAFFTIFFILHYRNKRRLSKAKKTLLIQFKDNVVPFTKKKYEELFDFIRKYPLRQQRLHNEFMPHSVAFGLDTSWNESFGIPTETLVSSRAVGQLSPGGREKFGELE